ncbi:MAG: ribonuclease H-like domain-containing protein [Candidatus Pacebacteria bacterium]|nr:ribonuclease H-like domain-containing protein [Candidatus Paceibacterota bacterium]
MTQVFLDVETKQSFSAVEDRDPAKLGISFVGIYQRSSFAESSLFTGGVKDRSRDQGEFGSFFEADLAKLWPILEKADLVIGYNILKFDYPAMSPYYPGNFQELPTLDLLEVVKDSLGKRLRLDNLAQASLGTGKIADGWDAIRFWREGQLDKLEEYCLKDVEVTRDLYDFGKKNGFWRYVAPPDEIKEFPIKWPQEEKKEGVSLTLGI